MALVEQTLFGEVDKVQMAIERIKTFEPSEGYYGATSFGKDSITVMQLAKEANVKIDWHYSVTTIDPPEIIYFGRKFYPDVIREYPVKPFLSRLVEVGFPTRLNRWCCREYKENGGGGRKVITGLRWAESRKRSKRKLVEHCLKDESKIFVNPIIDWTDEDVWEFIHNRNLDYCSLYNEGFRRIGCVFCPQNSKRKEHRLRWPNFEKAFINAFNKLYSNRKGRGMKSVDRWDSGIEMFEWWING